MKTVLAFLAVNVVLAMANIVAAGVVYASGSTVLGLWPGAAEDPGIWYAIAAIAVTAAIAFVAIVVKSVQGARP